MTCASAVLSHVISRLLLSCDRISIKLQLTGKSRLISQFTVYLSCYSFSYCTFLKLILKLTFCFEHSIVSQKRNKRLVANKRPPLKSPKVNKRTNVKSSHYSSGFYNGPLTLNDLQVKDELVIIYSFKPVY